MTRHDAVFAELATVAHRPGAPHARARALLTPLQDLFGYDGVDIALHDPERRSHQPLVRHGHPPSADDLVIALRAADGSLVGCLALHLPGPVPEETRALLTTVAPIVAHAIDPRPLLAEAASLITAPIAGTVLTRAGNTEPLPSLPGSPKMPGQPKTPGPPEMPGPREMPGHPLLARGSPTLTEARACLAAGATHATYLAAAGHFFQVTVLSTAHIPPGHRIGLVLLSAPQDLRELTHRELTLLGLRLAGRRGRPAFDSIATMNAIRAKLGVSSRRKALLYAAAHGLYLPAGHCGDP
ncbi:hypothetical protein [Actinoplanes sp. NPDC023714]|uniref:hypothetical protein n=1 Tax=Actinoplanes sp. NPDC023714 TaxID=3154322 RepID=UPI003406C25C